MIRGRITQLDPLTYVITELPIGRWTQDYKKFLTELVLPEKKAPLIADFKENHTDTTVHFTVTLTEEQAKALEGQDLYKFFKLETSITTTNFYLFDQDGHIHHYDSAQDIVDMFFEFRLPLYQKRKDLLIATLEKETRRLRNMTRFILAVVNGELVVNNRPRKDILRDLVQQGYDTFYASSRPEALPEDTPATVTEEFIPQADEEDTSSGLSFDEKTTDLSKGYNYLLSMKLWKLTREEVENLKKQLASKEKELEVLQATTVKQMWESDLDAFVDELLKVGE